jgi:hypothetical protein
VDGPVFLFIFLNPNPFFQNFLQRGSGADLNGMVGRFSSAIGPFVARVLPSSGKFPRDDLTGTIQRWQR